VRRAAPSVAPGARCGDAARGAAAALRRADRGPCRGAGADRTSDNGKPLTDTTTGDLPAVTQMFHYWAGRRRQDRRRDGRDFAGQPQLRQARADRRRRIVIPWNSPISVFAAKAGAALAAGNTIVVKPRDRLLLGAGCRRFVRRSGFPPGVVNVVAGLGTAAGDALSAHPDVGKITLTGSTATARAITRRSADAIKPLSFELGGKFGQYRVRRCRSRRRRDRRHHDGGLHHRRRPVLHRRLAHPGAGQDFNEMVARIAKIARDIRPGDPMDKACGMGPIALDRQFHKVKDYIALGRSEGGEVLFGGRSGPALFDSGSPFANGYFVEPPCSPG